MKKIIYFRSVKVIIMKELYSIKKMNRIAPKRGTLLLSEPFLLDPFFKRSVILLTEDNENGSVGFVLTQPTDIKINNVMEDFPPLDNQLYIGGPVAKNTLHYIHTLGDKIDGSIEILDDLFWGGNFDTLKMLIDTEQIDNTDIKFFIGYSGWTTEQLKREIEENSWLVAEGNVDKIMMIGTTHLWRNILLEMGGEYAMIANFPENPILN